MGIEVCCVMITKEVHLELNKITIAKKNPLMDKLIFLDGISRAGKFFVGKIISGFKKIEYFQYVSVLEHLPFMAKLGCINEDAAICLLQVNVDEHAYNMRIGRNLNLRTADASSLHNSPDMARYIKRSTLPVDEKIIEKIKNGDRACLFVLHESLPNIKIFLKAFPGLKWINLIRHPIDIIHSWYLRGWGHRFNSDPFSFIPVVEWNNYSVPWYAYDWREAYKRMSGIDRLIKSIAVLSETGETAYRLLTEVQKKQVLSISYEDVVENTNTVLKRIGAFLDTVPLQGMSLILVKEKCPAKISIEKREKKIVDIKNIATKEMFDLMMHLASRYEKREMAYQDL